MTASGTAYFDDRVLLNKEGGNISMLRNFAGF
jgi:hypothetical protein